jgi:hypothetical protein
MYNSTISWCDVICSQTTIPTSLNWNVNTNCTQIPIKKHAVLNLGIRTPCQTTDSITFQNILFTLKLSSNLATNTFYKKNIHVFAAVHLITIHEVP